jgi:transposase-like protein
MVACWPICARALGTRRLNDVLMLLYLCLNRVAAEWKRPPREWSEAKTQFAIMFNERFVTA